MSDIAGNDLKNVSQLANTYLKWRQNRPQMVIRRFLQERLRTNALRRLYNQMSKYQVGPVTRESVIFDARVLHLSPQVLASLKRSS